MEEKNLNHNRLDINDLQILLDAAKIGTRRGAFEIEEAGQISEAFTRVNHIVSVMREASQQKNNDNENNKE